MMWRKMLILLFVLFLRVQGMQNDVHAELETPAGQKVRDDHHEAVHKMMEKVRDKLENIQSLLKNEDEYTIDNNDAKKSIKMYEEANNAITQYFEYTKEFECTKAELADGFEYLKTEASYEAIATILFIASSHPDCNSRKCLILEKWDLTKLFQLPSSQLASLTNDRWQPDHQRFLLKDKKGQAAFKVYWRLKNQPLAANEWSPFKDFDVQNSVTEPLLKKLPLKDEEAIDMQQPLRETLNGENDVYYDLVMANNELEHNRYWIFRAWFEAYLSAGIMKQYLDPNHMEWSMGDLKTFTNGKFFMFMGLLTFTYSFLYLNIVMKNDSRKLIIPENKPANVYYKVWKYFTNAIRDLFLFCMGVVGAIAKGKVITNPFGNFPWKDEHGNRNWRKFIGSLMNTGAAYGFVFLLGALAFGIAIWNHRGGIFETYNNKCYHLPYAGYTDFECWEHLAFGAMTYWLPSMTEGWKTPWMVLTAVPGGCYWFLTGMLIKLLKIDTIEPILEGSSHYASAGWKKLYKAVGGQRNLETDDNLDLHLFHGLTKGFEQLIGAGIIYAILKVVLIWLLSWPKMYFTEYWAFAVGIQAAYFGSLDLLPTNKVTRHIGPIVTIIDGVVCLATFGLFFTEAGTTGEGVFPQQSALDYVKNMSSTVAEISVVAVLVSFVMQKMRWMYYNKKNQNKMLYAFMDSWARTGLEKLGYGTDLLPGANNRITWRLLVTGLFCLIMWFVLKALPNIGSVNRGE